MYRTLSLLIGLALLTLALVGLTFSASVEGRADFRFINGTEPKTLDPHLATGEPESRVLDGLFEGLTRLEAKSHEVVGGVARSWTISPDERTYTFTLRDDAKWSDGRPVTAQDFVYSWKRLLDPALGGQYAYLLHGVRHARAYNTYAGHIERLRGPIRKAATLLAERGSALSGAAWQRELTKMEAHSALERATSTRLRTLLHKAEGRISPAELREFTQLVEGTRKELDAALSEAKQHLGKDQGVFAPGDRTLVVELEAPVPYFLELTSYYATRPAPSWVVEAEGNARDWFLPDKIISNGAFILKSWHVNDHLRLEKNPHYWDRAKVRLNSIDVISTENVTTSLNLYLTGEVDWLPKNYPEDLAAKLKERDDFYVGPGLVVYFYRINTTRPPLDDPRVRKALNLAIDRKVIADEVLGRGEIPAHHIVPPGMAGYEPPRSEIRFDVPEARRLLAEAGFDGGKGIGELGILYNTFETHRKIAEVVADQLARNLGIKVSAYNQEWQSYLATTRSMDFDLARAGWIGDYADPNTFLDMWVTNGGNNETGFSSPAYDALIRAAGNVPAYLDDPSVLPNDVPTKDELARLTSLVIDSPPRDQARMRGKLRMALLGAAEAILVQEGFFVIPIYFYVNSGLKSPRVAGLYTTLIDKEGNQAANLQDLHPLRAIYIK